MSTTLALGGAATLVAAALAWSEWRRPGGLRALRTVAAVSSVVCLLLIAVRPTRTVRDRSATTTIVTPGIDGTAPAADFAIGLTLPGVETVPDLGWIARHRPASSIRILGWGLDEEQWPDPDVTGLPFGVEAALAPAPAGVVSITWPSSLVLGQEAVVRGRLGPRSRKTRIVLADAGGALDSAYASGQDPSFTLRARPRAVGQWRALLRLDPGQGAPIESLAIQVRPASPPRVLIVESSPSFETRFLRDWLAAQGAEVRTHTTVTRGRTRITGFNAPPSAVPSREALEKLDVLILRGRSAASLETAEIRRGLGLVVMADDSVRSSVFSSEVLVRDSSGTPTVGVTAAGAGRIARTAVSTVPRRLRGDSAGYAVLWSRILAAVRRRSSKAIVVEGEGPRFANRPATIVARGDEALTLVEIEAGDGRTDTVHLAATPWDGSIRRGVFWPPRPGWYRVAGAAGTEFFVHDTTEWMAVQAQRRIDATLARVMSVAPPHDVSNREPIPLWPAFLGFLSAAAFLWWAHLGRRSQRPQQYASWSVVRPQAR